MGLPITNLQWFIDQSLDQRPFTPRYMPDQVSIAHEIDRYTWKRMEKVQAPDEFLRYIKLILKLDSSGPRCL